MSAAAPSVGIWGEINEWYRGYIESAYDNIHPDEIHGLPPENRGSWFCPCVTRYDAENTHPLLQRHGINRVVDLGAGDFRFALHMDALGYDVIAYETLDRLVDAIQEEFYLGGIDVRRRDYYKDFSHLTGPDTAVCAFGKTNELPHVPNEGIALYGYSEICVSVWLNGDQIAKQWGDLDFIKVAENGGDSDA